MVRITRRLALGGTAAAMATAMIPGPAAALAIKPGYGGRIAHARTLLEVMQAADSRCALYESMANVDRLWSVKWQRPYLFVIVYADQLRADIRDDTPETRAILQTARAILPPPCERAHTYWDAIPDLSGEFRKRGDLFFRLRERLARAGDDGVTPELHTAWVHTTASISALTPESPGDFELIRRVWQSYGHDKLLDVPYLRTCGGDWRSRYFKDHRRSCGALACRECAEWFA